MNKSRYPRYCKIHIMAWHNTSFYYQTGISPTPIPHSLSHSHTNTHTHTHAHTHTRTHTRTHTISHLHILARHLYCTVYIFMNLIKSPLLSLIRVTLSLGHFYTCLAT